MSSEVKLIEDWRERWHDRFGDVKLITEQKRIEVDGTLPDWEYTDTTVDTTPPQKGK